MSPTSIFEILLSHVLQNGEISTYVLNVLLLILDRHEVDMPRCQLYTLAEIKTQNYTLAHMSITVLLAGHSITCNRATKVRRDTDTSLFCLATSVFFIRSS